MGGSTGKGNITKEAEFNILVDPEAADICFKAGVPMRMLGLNVTRKILVKDEVIMIMNMKKRTLKFIINNEDKGDSYIDIPIDKPLFPALFLYDKNDCVEINEIE